jgi:copper resistance protein C
MSDGTTLPHIRRRTPDAAAVLIVATAMVVGLSGARSARLELASRGEASTLRIDSRRSAHLELLSSDPQKDQSIARPPIDIALVFSESVDSARTTVTLDGPSGKVELGPVRLQDEALVVLAKVTGRVGAGIYTVSWVAAAPEMDPVKGSFRFTVRSR